MIKIIIPILSMLLLAGCASSNSTQVIAAVSGLNAGATLGGAIGGLTSRSARGYHMGTTIGALSGAAIGIAATTPRQKRDNNNVVEESEVSSEYTPRRKREATFAPLSGLRRDLRVTNVHFSDASGDGTLQSGETATISYDIINVTPNEIGRLIPEIKLSRQAKRIHISPMHNIDYIPSGEEVRYSVTLTASPRLKQGYSDITLYLSSDDAATFTAMNTLQIKLN